MGGGGANTTEEIGKGKGGEGTDRQTEPIVKLNTYVQTAVTPSARENVVQGSKALAEFVLWLRTHGYTEYDHALLFTG